MSGDYFILCIAASEQSSAELGKKLLHHFGDYFAVEFCREPSEAADRINVFERLGRKTALLIVEEGEKYEGRAIRAAGILERFDLRSLPLLVIVPAALEEKVRIDLLAIRLSNPYIVISSEADSEETAAACRQLLTDFFTTSEKPDLPNYARVLDARRLSEDFLEADRERSTFRIQLRDFRTGLLRSPWKSNAEIVEEITKRIAAIADIESMRRRYEKGETILREGTPNSSLFLLEEGEVAMFKRLGGEEFEVGRLGKGKFAGILSFVEGRISFATVVALEPTTVIRITAAELNRLFNEDVGLAALLFNQMLRVAAARIRAQTELQITVDRLNKQIRRERDELREALDKLERARMKLVESEKLAVLGQLVAGIAHELNNPVGAIERGTEQLFETLILLLEEMAGLAPEDAEHVVPIGLEVLKKAASAPPPALARVRSDAREIVAAEGVSLPTARMLAEMGIDPDKVKRLFSDLPGTREPHRFIKILHSFHLVGRWLRNLSVSSERIESLVSSLRSYARPATDEPEDYDLIAGIEDTLLILGHRLKNIRIERDYAVRPVIPAVAGEMNQVWTNIISNAAEAMNGRGRITIRTREVPGGVEVEIEDDGPGIPPEHIGRIWDINFTTRKGGASFGLGLGLAITKEIVESHDGKISVDSRPGRTRFTVFLPVPAKDKGRKAGKEA